MPTFSQLDPKQIIVNRDDRQRRGIESTGLIESIQHYGILNPIIVTRDGVLVAGERRLTAALELGLAEVPVRYLEDLPPIDLQIIELDENIKRRDLSWQDTCLAAAKIHALYLSQDPDWTQAETARAMGLSTTAIGNYVAIAKAMDDPRIGNAGTLGEARNILARQAQRDAGTALQEILDMGGEGGAGPLPSEVGLEVFFPDGAEGKGHGQASGQISIPDYGPPGPILAGETVPMPAAPWPASPLLQRLVADPGPAHDPSPSIITGDFIQWAKTYSGPKFNFLHCDFPYGINAFSAEQMGANRHGDYDDSPGVYFGLIETLCTNLNSLLGVNAHVMFWFSDKHRAKTLEMFAALAPSIVWAPFPLVWWKTDNAGIAGDVRRHPRHVYETALFGSRGGRNLVKVKSDAYGSPTDKKYHTSAKPESMLRHFFEMVVDQHTEMLDPTCGGGSSIRAAESLGAKRVQGLEIDPGYANAAREALHNARLLRSLG